MSQFEFKIVAPDQPLIEDPYYAWLEANYNKGDRNSPRLPIRAYLESLGFGFGIDQITEEQYKTLKYVEEFWFRSTPWYKEVFQASELFITDTLYDQFWITGSGINLHRAITPKLRIMVEESGWVQPVLSSTTYFEVLRGNEIWAKYQTILGSRFICKIEGEIE